MNNAAGAAAAFLIILYIAVVVLLLAAMWRIYTKAGKPGWAALIPIYNIIVLLEIAEMPLWYIILMLIPIVNIVIGIMVWVSVLKHFGQPGWHVILLILFGIIYLPWLAWGKAQYQKTGTAT